MDRSENDLTAFAAHEVMLLKLGLVVIGIIGVCTVLSDACLPPFDARHMVRISEVAEVRTYSRSNEISNPQTSTDELTVGSSRTKVISNGQVQTFTVNLNPNEFAEVKFEWQGIDLNIVIYDAAGTELLPSCTIVSAPGPVTVVMKAGQAGKHRIEVTTPVRQKISGSYNVRLEVIRTASSVDDDRVVAQDLIAAALKSNSPLVAVQQYIQALQWWQTLNNEHARAQTLLLLGNAYRDIRDPKTAQTNIESAANSFKSAAAIWKQKGYKRGEAYALINLGNLFRQRIPASARDSYVEAAGLFKEIGDSRGQADALYGHAFALMNLSRASEALELLTQVLPLRRAFQDRLGEALTLNVMADAYRILGEPDKSLAAYDEATKAVAGLEHPLLEAALLNGRAVVSDDQSKWETAKQDYLNVLEVYESLLGSAALAACTPTPTSENRGTCRATALTLINLGEVYNSLNKSTEAFNEITKSVQIGEALAEPLVQGESELHLGYTLYLLGKLQAAMDHFRRALTFEEQAKNDTKVALTLVYMGMIEVADNQPRLALSHYQQAMDVLHKTGDKRALAIALDKFATCQQLLGNRVEANNKYAKALDLWKQLKDVDGEALTLNNMAEAARQSGNLGAAIEHSEAAIKLVESLRSTIRNEKFRVSYFADKKSYYELNIELKMQLGRQSSDERLIAEALQTSEMARARMLLDTLNDAVLKHTNSVQETNPTVVQLLKQKNDLASRLRAKGEVRTGLLSSGSQPANGVLDKEIDKLIEQLGEVDAAIRVKNPRLAELTTAQVASTQDIQQQLDSDTVMLEFALGDKRSYAWAVTTNKVYGYELASRREIESAAMEMLSALLSPGRSDPKESYSERQRRLAEGEKVYRKASTTLSKLILDPLSKQLDHKRVVIIADGALQLVPFTVLPQPNSLGDNQQILLNKAEIMMLPSASVLVSQRRYYARQAAHSQVAVIADPVFDRDDERVAEFKKKLPNPLTKLSSQSSLSSATPNHPAAIELKTDSLDGALRDVGLDPNRLGRLWKSGTEAAAISDVVPPKQLLSLLGFEANKKTVTNGALAGYRYVHFATHGLVDLERPELSGIVLSRFNNKGEQQDGYLRFYEIYDLKLAANLVMLSACQTGTGKQVRGEGLLALTNAFISVGATTVGATLWNVNDTATAELMKRFYQEMFLNHNPPSAALREAQLSIANQKRWNAPYFWAGFVLQGEWR